MIPDRVREHTERFNQAVRAADFGPFVGTFATDAVMRFEGGPGPFAGRAEIADAYAAQPPTDTLTVQEVHTDGDTDVVRFTWDAGGAGTLTVVWRNSLVAELAVRFD